VYILYVAISTIILLSLLIAMMTDTFTDIKSKEATTWQVGSLRLALHIERVMPFLRRRVLCCSGRDRFTYDDGLGRWMMSTRAVGVGGGGRATAAASCGREESLDELVKVVQRLDNRLDHLQSAYVELSRQVDLVVTAVQRDSASVGAGVGSRRAPPLSLYNAAMMMRSRPTSAAGRKPAVRSRKS